MMHHLWQDIIKKMGNETKINFPVGAELQVGARLTEKTEMTSASQFLSRMTPLVSFCLEIHHWNISRFKKVRNGAFPRFYLMRKDLFLHKPRV